MKRERLQSADDIASRVTKGGNYFSNPNTDKQFINTGCQMLDLSLGGGWAEGRIANIVGDKSTGKTLLCIEAAANFVKKYEKGVVYYRESESAFDKNYAEALGMPLERVKFKDTLETVEDFYNDLVRVLDRTKGPALYILDSLDALSDKAEMERGIADPTYGGTKPKQMSQLFRRLVRRIEKTNTTVLIVSQVRDKIGAMFGEKHSRTGGRALDFYATHVLFLSHIKTVTKVRKGLKRAVAINVRAKVKKNKVSLPFREADFTIRFGYGIDDALASLSFLKEAKALDSIEMVGKTIDDYAKFLIEAEPNVYNKHMKRIRRTVRKEWKEIEDSFLPPRRKYN